jgi:DNA polymerase III epsilon subunit-like protein
MTILALFDTETTGIAPERGDQVVQFAAFMVDLTSGEQYEFSSLCDPGRPIPEGASKIHGVTDDKVKGAPSFPAVLDDFNTSLRGLVGGRGLVYGGHNVQFDIRFLPKDGGLLDHQGVVCTLRLARRTWPNLLNHQLSTVYREVCPGGGLLDNAHNASADVEMCWEVIKGAFRKQAAEKQGQAMGMEQFVQSLSWISKSPTRLETMPFGKHKGVKFADIPVDYIEWCLRTWTKVDPDVKHSMLLRVKGSGT